MWKGGFSDLELELGRRVSQVGLGDAAVTTNHKISVLKEHILWYTDIYIYVSAQKGDATLVFILHWPEQLTCSHLISRHQGYRTTMCLENELEIFGEQQALGSLGEASVSFFPWRCSLGGLTCVLVGQSDLYNSAFFQS